MLDLDAHSRTQKGQGLDDCSEDNHALSGRITTTQMLVQQICKIAKGVGGTAGN